jgi:hypothetical protein
MTGISRFLVGIKNIASKAPATNRGAVTKEQGERRKGKVWESVLIDLSGNQGVTNGGLTMRPSISQS